MNNTFLKFVIITSLTFFSTQAFSQVNVKGYTRKDGSYVQGHQRSAPNKTVKDNYTYKGNRNPHTYKKGTEKYKGSPSSDYYRGYKSKSGR